MKVHSYCIIGCIDRRCCEPARSSCRCWRDVRCLYLTVKMRPAQGLPALTMLLGESVHDLAERPVLRSHTELTGQSKNDHSWAKVRRNMRPLVTRRPLSGFTDGSAFRFSYCCGHRKPCNDDGFPSASRSTSGPSNKTPFLTYSITR